MSYIPYGRQNISDNDIAAVIEVLKSDWLTQGPVIEIFEQAVAKLCGAKYAVAVNSATSALHLACLAAGLTANSIAWTSPNTFLASANCARYCGAAVDFVDIDERTYNMSVEELENRLSQAEKNAKLPHVVIPVHFSGQACEMEQFHRLAGQYKFTLIEDASHGIGGQYKETQVGSCAYSDMTVLSFHPVKIITTGEGGMVLTNREDLYEKLTLLRSHGMTRKPEMMTEASHGPWYYQQLDLGFNYRTTDIQAALGNSQLTRITEFVARRQEIAATYDEWLKELPLALPWQHPNTKSAYHLYVICLQLDKIKYTRRQVFEKLRAANIGVNVHYIPVHTQPYYQQFGFRYGDFPNAEKYYQETISLPMYYGLTADDQQYVINKLQEILA